VVEAGLYLTAGTKVTLRGFGDERDGSVVAARRLAGGDGLLFRRHSVTGAVEAVARSGVGVRLNSALHAG
ncbi:MAG: 2,3,4,5-tetrahydropyridine-2,6-dicarboxylate N-succinyltransferase, partial [Micrococcales bacterium]|nr:2,3,4,5-tetrahydropyridine-2,6-dicarboxylate N-succinyltransferase [Micrococcales bacterium]